MRHASRLRIRLPNRSSSRARATGTTSTPMKSTAEVPRVDSPRSYVTHSARAPAAVTTQSTGFAWPPTRYMPITVTFEKRRSATEEAHASTYNPNASSARQSASSWRTSPVPSAAEVGSTGSRTRRRRMTSSASLTSSPIRIGLTTSIGRLSSVGPNETGAMRNHSTAVRPTTSARRLSRRSRWRRTDRSTSWKRAATVTDQSPVLNRSAIAAPPRRRINVAGTTTTSRIIVM